MTSISSASYNYPEQTQFLYRWPIQMILS